MTTAQPPASPWTAPAGDERDITRRIAKGAAWMVVCRVTDRAIGLASTLVLVRVLAPADFGLIAMATSIIAALEVLGAFSFDLALIQKRNADRALYDTAWTLDVLLSIACAAILVLLASPAADFYAEPRLSGVMYALAIAVVIHGFQNIGIVAFRKDMEFHKEFRFQFTARILTFIVTVTLALSLRSYWALVAGMIAGRLVGLVLSYSLHDYRPRFSLAGRAELIGFSKWLFLNNAVFFLNTRLADFVVGRAAGSHALGLYAVSFEVSNLPTSELAAPVNRAVYPGYSKMSADVRALRDGFLSVISMIALLALPAGAGISSIADLLVPVVFGAQWLEAVPLVQILALYGVCAALQTNTGVMFIALGKPHVLTITAAVQLAMLVPLMIWLTHAHGALGAAIAVGAVALLFLPANYFLLLRSTELGFLRLFAAVWRPFAATALMVCAVQVAAALIDLRSTVPSLELLLLIVVGACSYFAALFGLWRLAKCPAGAEAVIVSELKRRLGSAAPASGDARV